MKCTLNSKAIQTAYRYIWNMHTKKEQDQGINLILDVTSSEVRLIGLNAVSVYSTVIEEALIDEVGAMQIHSNAVTEWLKEKDAQWEIEGRDDWLRATAGTQVVTSTGVEVELEPDSWTLLSTAQTEDVLAMFKELLSSPLKTARAFTDTFLLRFNGTRVNGRLMTMQTIITASLILSTRVTQMTDVYLSKKDAQTINKALKTMKPADTVSFYMDNGRIKLVSNGYDICLIHSTGACGMPDITKLMRRIQSFEERDSIQATVADWKKALMAKQKAEKDTDTDMDALTYGIDQSGQWTDDKSQLVARIRVKDTLKLLKTIETKAFHFYVIPMAVVLKYDTSTRNHISVLMTGKE